MKLAYLVSQYPAANHTYILREVTRLRRVGFEIDVISIRPDDRSPGHVTAVEREERERTFAVKSLSVPAVLASHARVAFRRPGGYLGGLALALRLARLDLRQAVYNLAYFAQAVVAGERLEALGHVRVHTHYASTVCLLMVRVFPLSMSATIHGSAEFINPAKQWLREKVSASRVVCAISSYGRSQLMYNSSPADWGKIVVTPLGIDPVMALPRERARTGGPFVVACVAQLQPAKGLHLLLDAVHRVVATGHDVRLRLVGDGSERATLQAAAERLGIADRVAFEGWMNQEGVNAVYASSDAFVLASFAEGIPVVLMEAMSHALPCVATRITGIPELMRDEKEGLLVTPADVDDLALALRRLAEDSALCVRLGAAARARVLERYDLERNVDALAAVFRHAYGEVP
jgi:glycosyltransferase involved in cell wall biosynthesis